MDLFTLIGKVVIDGVDKAEKQLSGLEGYVKKNEASFKAWGGVLTGVGVAVTGIATLSAKAAIEIDSTSQSFTSLARANLQSADEILAALKRASAGTVSANDLMLSANRAMTLGVAKNSEQFTTLMEIARDRARAMGLSTTQAFNDIVTGIGRGSPLILDNLGLVINLTEANEAYARELGKDAAQLTEAEKKQALLNEVLRQGEETVDKSSLSNLTAKETIQALTTSVVDITAKLGKHLIPIIQTGGKLVTDIVDKFQAWSDENPVLTKVLVITATAIGGVAAVMGPLLLMIPNLIAGWKALKIAMIAHKVAAAAATAAQWLWNAALTANPIGIVIMAITALVAAGIALWRNWDKVVAFFKDAWEYIKIAFATSVKFIIEKVLGPFIDFHLRAFEVVGGALAKFVGIFNKDAGEAISGFVEKMKGAKSEIVSWTDSLIENSKQNLANNQAAKAAAAATKESGQAAEAAGKQYAAYGDYIMSTTEDLEEYLKIVTEAVNNTKYQMSEAGKLGLTLDNVIAYESMMGKTNEEIARTLEGLGTKGNDVNAVLEAFGDTAQGVAGVLQAWGLIAKTTANEIQNLDNMMRSLKETGQFMVDANGNLISTGGGTYASIDEYSWVAQKLANGMTIQDIMEQYPVDWRGAGSYEEHLQAIADAIATQGHAAGGIFSKEHIARFAEGGIPEAIIPLNKDLSLTARGAEVLSQIKSPSLDLGQLQATITGAIQKGLANAMFQVFWDGDDITDKVSIKLGRRSISRAQLGGA